MAVYKPDAGGERGWLLFPRVTANRLRLNKISGIKFLPLPPSRTKSIRRHKLPKQKYHGPYYFIFNFTARYSEPCEWLVNNIHLSRNPKLIPNTIARAIIFNETWCSINRLQLLSMFILISSSLGRLHGIWRNIKRCRLWIFRSERGITASTNNE